MRSPSSQVAVCLLFPFSLHLRFSHSDLDIFNVLPGALALPALARSFRTYLRFFFLPDPCFPFPLLTDVYMHETPNGSLTIPQQTSG